MGAASATRRWSVLTQQQPYGQQASETSPGGSRWSVSTAMPGHQRCGSQETVDMAGYGGSGGGTPTTDAGVMPANPLPCAVTGWRTCRSDDSQSICLTPASWLLLQALFHLSSDVIGYLCSQTCLLLKACTFCPAGAFAAGAFAGRRL